MVKLISKLLLRLKIALMVNNIIVIIKIISKFFIKGGIVCVQRQHIKQKIFILEEL